MKRLLLLALVLVAGCEFFRSTAPHTQPCKAIGYLTVPYHDYVDTIGIIYDKTFYCAIPPDTQPRRKHP